MKGLRRAISIVLVAVMLFTSFAFSGCTKKSSVPISFGEWIKMLDMSFGMESYTSDLPYFSFVSKDNEYFEAIQIAYEWGVFSGIEEFDVSKPVTWRDAILTIVNCGDFAQSDAREEDKIETAINLFGLKLSKGKLKRAIKSDKAEELLATAHEIWANNEYTEKIEEVKYSKGVLDFSHGDNIITDYSVLEDGTFVIPTSEVGNIKAGDVYILPSNGEVFGTNAYKASQIISEGGYTYIKNSDEELDLYDIAEDIKVQSTYSPTYDNTIIRDGNGQIISVGSNIKQTELGLSNLYSKPEVKALGTSTDGAKITNCGGKVSHEFKVDVFKVKLEYDLDGKVDLKASLSYEKKSATEQSSIGGSFSVGVSDLSITQDIDYSWFTLHSAKLAINYKTKTEFQLKYSNSVTGVFAPKYSNGNGKFLSNLSRSVLKNENTDSYAKTIKICSLDVWDIGVCRACLDVNLQVKFDGTLTLTITEHGSKGFEYRNGNLRQINDCHKDVDLTLKAKIEATIGIGPALYIIGLKKPIVGLQVKAGIGIEFSVTWHLVDAENHLLETMDDSDNPPEAYDPLADLQITGTVEAIKQVAAAQGCEYNPDQSVSTVILHTDQCFDVSAYFILRIELTDTSYLADILGGKIKTSFEIFGSKNAKFLNIHVEDRDWSQLSNIKWGSAANKSQCTKEYKPFDKAEETTIETTTQSSAGSFAISTYSLALTVGGSERIDLDALPEGYDKSDIVFSSDDVTIAKVSSEGMVTAIGSGSTSVVISTSDGKYSVTCAVIVTEPMGLFIEENSFETIKAA